MKISNVHHNNARDYGFEMKNVKVMLPRKICFLHMRLNSMDVKNINACLGNLGWILRKTSEEALAHGKTKLELEYPQFMGQGLTSQPSAADSGYIKKRCHFYPTKA